MTHYEAIQEQINRARIQRSVYLSKLIADQITSLWNGVKNIADVLFSAARAKNPKGHFTFDA